MKIQHYNEMMKYLTRSGPSKKVQSLRKKINEQPNASVEELVNQVQKEFSEDKITTKRPNVLDKATTNIIKNHVKYDEDEDLSVSYNPTTKIFSNKSRTIGFQKYEDADKYNKLIGAKTDNYPKQATPEQVKYLKKNLEKYKQTNGTKKPLTSAEKLNGDRKVRKYILNQIKNKTTVPEFKLDTKIPDAVKPEPVKQLTKQELLEEIQKHARENKVPVSPNDATGIFSSNEYFLRKRGI